jgi:anion-transporting  ArsA/GET3 family ATPase
VTSKAAQGLFDRRLLIVAGKGGVGRTTVASALALAAARSGKRVLLAQTKSKDRLPRLFGVDKSFAEVQPIDSNLWAVNMTPESALREYGVMVLRSAFVYRQVFERDVVRAFLRAIPGLYDYSMLGKVWFHTTEQVGGRPRFDLVVLDAPATGHSLTLLAIPKVILETVPEGPLTGPARDCQALLTDPLRTRAVLCTLAEDLPVSETLQLASGLGGLNIAVGPLVVNRLYPPRWRSGLAALALDELANIDDPQLRPLLRAASLQRQRSRLNEQYVQKLHEKLPLPQLHTPYVFSLEFGRAAIDLLADRIAEQVGGLGNF